MRLDRALAQSGYGSRSQVRDLIRSGRVKIDGSVCRLPQQKVDPQNFNLVTVDDLPAGLRIHTTIMLHKPAGYLTALDDHKQPTIADLIPDTWLSTGLSPVGRLDRDTTGLLLLTNWGQLNHRLTSPKYEIDKTYRLITTGRPFDDADPLAFQQGIRLTDGFICRPAELVIHDIHCADLTLTEGKFHQVKRMMLATGRQVTSLHRWRIGPLTLDPELPESAWRELSAAETGQLCAETGLS